MQAISQQNVAALIVCLWGVVLVQADEMMLLGSDASIDSLLRIDRTTGQAVVVGTVADPVVASLAYDPNHEILYGSSTVTDHLLVIEPCSGQTTIVGSFGRENFTFHAMEYDSINDLLYGAQEKQDGSKGSELYQIDVNTAAASLVGANDVVEFVGGMAFDYINNVLYLSDPADDLLYTVDRATGAVQIVGSFGVGGNGMGVGLAFHPDDELYASHNQFSKQIDDELYLIDMETAKATLIGPIESGNLSGLTFIPPLPCPWDLNCDGSVGALDLLYLLGAWGIDPIGPPDFDGNGTVGASDLLALLANWGPCP